MRVFELLKKKITFMLIPSTDGLARQFRISYGLILSLGLIAITVVTGSFVVSSLYFSNQVNKAELEKLQAENENLIDNYEQMRWNLAEVENRYDELVASEIKIRTLFGLPEISPDERQLGIGGPSVIDYDKLTPSAQFAAATEMEVDQLLRISRFELEKYTEVETSLIKLKDRLDHTPSIWPTTGWNSRGYGMKFDPFTGYKQMHRGIDVANPTGTPVIATADGKIEKATSQSGMGIYITVNHGYGFKTRYGHLSKILVKRGQKVKRGDVIALMGSTGYSTGPHLHYEVIRNGKFLNPRKFILNKK